MLFISMTRGGLPVKLRRNSNWEDLGVSAGDIGDLFDIQEVECDLPRPELGCVETDQKVRGGDARFPGWPSSRASRSRGTP